MSGSILQLVFSESNKNITQNEKRKNEHIIEKETDFFQCNIPNDGLIRQYFFYFQDKDKKILPILKEVVLSMNGQHRLNYSQYGAHVIDKIMFNEKVPKEHIYSIIFTCKNNNNLRNYFNAEFFDNIVLKINLMPQDEDIYLIIGEDIYI